MNSSRWMSKDRAPARAAGPFSSEAERMTAIPPHALEMVHELLGLLDEEIRLLRLRADQFDELYEAILRRNDGRMESLLEEMTNAQHQQADVDTKLHSVRSLFAKALGRDADDMRLSVLIGRLDKKRSMDLEYKREQIILLAETLKRKHLRTAILLSECARVNRMLLEGLLPRAESVTTYGTGGAQPWRMGSGLVDTEM